MKLVTFAFGFAAIAFGIRAARNDNALLSWLAAIMFAMISALLVLRGPKK
jgi:hypothetical protein